MKIQNLFLAFLLVGLISTSCSESKSKSRQQIKADAKEIIESKYAEMGEDLKVIDFSLFKASEYKYEGFFVLSNDEEYQVVVYYDKDEADDGFYVRWRLQNVFSGF